MTSQLKHILVGTDFSEAATAAINAAVRLARRDGAALTVLHVGSSTLQEGGWPLFVQISWQEARQALVGSLHARLHRDLERLHAEGLQVEERVDIGWAPTQLADRAEEWGAELIVVSAGSFGRVEAFFLGSTAEELARVTKRDMLVIRGDGLTPFKRVLVATDFSPNSEAAFDFARAMAAAEDATLELIHVWHDPGEGGLLSVASDQERARYREEVRLERSAQLEAFATQHGEPDLKQTLLSGRPSRAILDHAAATQADLLVVGSHGQGRIRDLFLGSTTEKILRRAGCSVAVVRTH